MNKNQEFDSDIVIEKVEKKSWENADNIDIYENLPVGSFYDIAVTVGLDTGLDVDLIKDYILASNSILEVGAGYGRVINHIVNLGYKGRLVAVERSKKTYKFLTSQFVKNKKIEIHNEDIKNFNQDEKFDLILWLWLGVAEFTIDEQKNIFSLLSRKLNINGKLIFDTLPLDGVIDSIKIDDQYHQLKTDYGVDHCYLPSEIEITDLADNAELKLERRIDYKSNTNRDRLIYILSK